MSLIVSVLNGTAAFGFIHSGPHRRRDGIGVKDDQAPGISRGAADGLNQGRFRTQKALFIRVQHGN